jgi:GNAT superfamily N-acetyltransferase
VGSTRIRLVKDADIDSVYALCAKEQWNHSTKVIKRLLDLEPNGCFVAEVDGAFAGQVFSVSFGDVGWIGLMIVDERYRRKGVATTLMKKAVAYLLDSGTRTIKLEAVPDIRGLYRKLGFVDELDSLRYVGTSSKNDRTIASNIEPLATEDIERVAEFDSKHFGANRLRLLEELNKDHLENCFFSHISSQVIGYIMAYEMDRGYRIGPWICDPEHPAVARELFAKCLGTFEAGAPLYVGVPAVNAAAGSILSGMGFKLVDKSIRMYLGPKTATSQGIFSICGPENG